MHISSQGWMLPVPVPPPVKLAVVIMAVLESAQVVAKMVAKR